MSGIFRKKLLELGDLIDNPLLSLDVQFIENLRSLQHLELGGKDRVKGARLFELFTASFLFPKK